MSYYDYYQPEAYIPQTDTYIEKDALINDDIDKLRHSATRSLLERRDVVIVASVSCIYGLGSPEVYYGMVLLLEEGGRSPRDAMLRKLVEIQYQRNDLDLHRGTFRVRGDVVEIFPAYDDLAIRVELFGDEVESHRPVRPVDRREAERACIASRSTPPTTTSRPRTGWSGPSPPSRRSWRMRLAGAAGREQAPGGAAAAPAHPLRSGDDAGDRLLQGDRELLPPPLRPRGRRARRRP